LGHDLPPGGEDQLARKAAAMGVYGTPAELAAMVEAAK